MKDRKDSPSINNKSYLKQDSSEIAAIRHWYVQQKENSHLQSD